MAANTLRPAAGYMNSGVSTYISGHHVRNAHETFAQRVQNLLGSFFAVRNKRPDVPEGVGDGGTMRWPINRVVALQQQVEALHVGLHVTVGRRDDARGPAHDVVAGEERLFFAQLEAHVVGRVPRCVHALDAPIAAFQHIAVADFDVG